MITLVWNDVPATQLAMASREAQRLAESSAEKEVTVQWARAAINAATAVDPLECDLAPFEALAAALTAVGDEELVKEAAEALAKHPQALFTLATVARGKKWEDLAKATMARCLVQTGALTWPAEFPYQQQWKQQFEEQLVATLLKVWKKRATRAVAKEAVALATDAEDLDTKQVEENLKALLTPADLWTTPTRRGRPARGRQTSSSRSRSSGSRRPATSGRTQRSTSRSRSTRKPDSDAN